MEQNYRIAFTTGSVKFEVERTGLAWLEAKEKEYLAKLSEASASVQSPPPPAAEPAPLPQNLTPVGA